VLPVAPGKQRDLRSLPIAAQGAASAGLAAKDRDHIVVHHAGVFTAVNASEHLRARFTPSRVTVSSGIVRFAMTLRAVGYGRELRPLTNVRPVAEKNWLEYRHTNVSERYVNEPRGIEQSFLVHRRPIAARRGPLTLALSLAGRIRASLLAGDRGLTIYGRGTPQLRYSDLLATDARGRPLRSWLELRRKAVLIRIDDRGAHYPVRIDPMIQQGSAIFASDEKDFNQFGVSVALSGDGNTALVGANNEFDGSGGAAYVFTRSGEAWSEQHKMTLPKSEGVGFGWNVALSADGNTAVVGAPIVRGVWIYTRSGTSWSPRQKIVISEPPAGSEVPVAISADGNTVAIGSPNVGAEEQGLVQVYTRSGEAWNEGPTITGLAKSKLGFSLALSEHGETAIVGCGSWTCASIWHKGAKTWEQVASFSGNSNFGISVAISADGDTALVGGELPGAWIFRRKGSEWARGAVLGSGGIVALSGNGNVALVGLAGEEGGVGAAWLFTQSGETWTAPGLRLAPRDAFGEAEFGYSIALSFDGSTAFIGGPGDGNPVNENALNGAGAVWAFANDLPPQVALSGPPEGTLTAHPLPTFAWSASDEGGAGLAQVEVLLDGASLSGPLGPGTSSFTPSAPLIDGSHTWQVRAVDKDGIATTTPARTITVDVTPPTVPVLLAPAADARLFQTAPVFSWLPSADATSGVASYTLVVDGVPTVSMSSGSCGATCNVASPRALPNGAHTWQVLATDRAGNAAATAPVSFVVAVGPPPPLGPVGLSIDNGDYATNNPNVQLDIVWPPGVTQAFISNDGGFRLAGQTALLPIAAHIRWKLRSQGNERLPKTVYVRFPDSAAPLNTLSDSIILDTTAPTIHSATLITTDTGGRRRSVGAKLNVHEDISGVSALEMSERPSGGRAVRFRARTERGLIDPHLIIRFASASGATRLPESAQVSSTPIKVRPPRHPKWVRVQNAAGTWSSWRRVS
jgi:hypothetical protein